MKLIETFDRRGQMWRSGALETEYTAMMLFLAANPSPQNGLIYRVYEGRSAYDDAELQLEMVSTGDRWLQIFPSV